MVDAVGRQLRQQSQHGVWLLFPQLWYGLEQAIKVEQLFVPQILNVLEVHLGAQADINYILERHVDFDRACEALDH